MSEEEIIKQLKDSCILDNNCYEVDCLYEKDLEAIRSLLDLYNKEKETNKELQKYMKEYLIPKSTINLVYISKDKIREIIGELEKQEDWYIEHNKSLVDLYDKIDLLQELLEERN